MTNKSLANLDNKTRSRYLVLYLDSDHHVEMPLGVLLNDISDIVGLSCLLKLPPGHEIFDLPDGADSILVGLSQATGKMGKKEK